MTEITKQKGEILKPQSTITQDELKLINSYTRREYTENELYTFSVVLCDNDIDRDGEAFSLNALTQLSKLFVGKTGIADHNPAANNQTARIYNCQVQEVPNRTTAFGGKYYQLLAKAYIPVLKSTEDIIQLIESGIRKEVSVGCSADSMVCSICGENIRQNPCSHYKGNSYNDSICYHILDNVSDAYEWSFVAVPSQKNAGVIKSYSYNKEENMQDILTEIKKGNYSVINSKNAEKLADCINQLQELADCGKEYRQELEKQYIRYSSLCFKGNSPMLADVAQKLSINELKQLVALYKGAVECGSYLNPQLVNQHTNASLQSNNSQYNI